MSVTIPARATCPFCGVPLDVATYRSLHVTRAPEVRAAILARAFQRHPCAACGRTVQVEPTMLYTDFHRGHWWATFPRAAIVHRAALAQQVLAGFRDNMERRCAPIVRTWASRFQVRVVFGLELLRERILAADHALDDSLLECLKLQIIRTYALSWLDWRSECTLDEVTAEQLIWRLVGPPSVDRVEVVRRIGLPLRAYSDVASTRLPLEATFPDLFTGPIVDWRAALAPHPPMAAGEPAPC